MNRRQILQGLAMLAASPIAQSDVRQIGNVTRASVARPSMIQQRCPLWCWAASISMIFSTHGHPVAQERIVEALFGQLVCVPSGPVQNMARLLTGKWRDDNGRGFDSEVTAAYDAWNGINNITDDFIFEELANDKPLLYCNRSHAMVNVLIEVTETPYGPRPTRVGAMDPYIGRYRDLSYAEAIPVYRGGEMTFLAAVNVS